MALHDALKRQLRFMACFLAGGGWLADLLYFFSSILLYYLPLVLPQGSLAFQFLSVFIYCFSSRPMSLLISVGNFYTALTRAVYFFDTPVLHTPFLRV